ncbi:MAG TPA: amidohydrolase, partial [Firmicutes bacterium]|nr:amidohydrolase [Bacillota bacterium]
MQPVSVELVDELIEQHLPQVVGIRRKIHSNPELGFEEQETTTLIKGVLEDLGLEIDDTNA